MPRKFDVASLSYSCGGSEEALYIILGVATAALGLATTKYADDGESQTRAVLGAPALFISFVCVVFWYVAFLPTHLQTVDQ